MNKLVHIYIYIYICGMRSIFLIGKTEILVETRKIGFSFGKRVYQ